MTAVRFVSDFEAGAHYLYLRKPYPSCVKRTKPVESDTHIINLDFGDDGEVIGVEIIGPVAISAPSPHGHTENKEGRGE